MNDNIGIFLGVPFSEYRKIDALNGSALVYMRRSPMYYRYMCDNPQPETDAQKLGTATHQMILEPEKVGDYAIWDSKVNGRRYGKKWDEFCAENEGKTKLTTDEADAMIGMAVAARKNPLVRKYLSAEGDCEVVMVWRDAGSGRLFKGRCDKIISATSTIVDLKTTRDCHPHKFGGQAFALSYHIKAAIYVSGYQALTGTRPKFKFLAIDSKAPHESAVYRATPDVLLQGGMDMDEILRKLTECESTGNWPPEMNEESDLVLPTYAYSSEDALDDFAMESAE